MSVIFLAEAKAYLEVAHTAQDSVIQTLIEGAEEFAERACGIKLASAAREEYLDGGDAFLKPTLRPVTAITLVTDMNGETEQDAALIGNQICRADEDGKPILPVVGNDVANYPAPPRAGYWDEGRKRYKVQYTGGHATIPGGLKIILLKMIRRDYFNREGAVSKDNTTWTSDAEFRKQLGPYNLQSKVSIG